MTKTPIENLRLRRTKQSTVREATSAAILLLTWVVGIVAFTTHKDTGNIFMPLIAFNLVVVLLHYISYRPAQRWVRNDFEPTTLRQAVVVGKFYRVLAIEIALVSLFIAIIGLMRIKDMLPKHVLGIILVVIVLGTYISTARKLMKVRDAERRMQQQDKLKQ